MSFVIVAEARGRAAYLTRSRGTNLWEWSDRVDAKNFATEREAVEVASMTGGRVIATDCDGGRRT